MTAQTLYVTAETDYRLRRAAATFPRRPGVHRRARHLLPRR